MPKTDIPIEVLIEQLHGEDWMARCDAARLLGQSRDPHAVDALLPDLKDSDWRVRRNAAQALGALRDKRAVKPLIEVLEDRTMTVRQRAIVALGRIKDPQALAALVEIILEEKHASYDAVQAIRKFGKKALPELAKAFEQTNNKQLMMLLIEMKYEGALDLILKLLESNGPATRLTAIRELGKLGDKKAIPHLIELLNHSDPTIQSEVVRALGKLGAVETIPALLNQLIDDELYGPRSSAYHALTEAFQIFGGITDEIKNAFPGNYPAMFNMGGAPISLPEAMGYLGNDQAHMLNEALSRLQSATQKPIEMLGIPSDVINKVFENMAWKFGVMFADARDAGQDHVKRLKELLKSESNVTRAAVALTLPWYSDEGSLRALEQVTKDSDEIVRKAATWAFQALQKTLLYRKQFGL
ncbi:MAG TPA: HEAT repeat domain-containing protein [Anaerolineales bacterium]|nr:HEAT repeat domain-containing protein [Anaerolineales bacterium]